MPKLAVQITGEKNGSLNDQWLATWQRNKIADFLLPTYF